MTTPQTHVVFGAGQIGPRLARRLQADGHAVRLVRRAGEGPAGVTVLHGDAGDPAFASAAAKGAAAIYHCMNPVYDTKVWARELPRLMTSLITAAGGAGARLLVLDNLYMLGRPKGRPLDEDSPIAPCSRKGELRAEVNARLLAAEQRGELRAVVGRASDFYGPGGVGTYFGDSFWPDAFAKGSVRTLANLDTRHSYHFTEDVAAGLALLGTAPDDVTGRWWMLPCAPAGTTREMIARLGQSLGRELTVRPTPRLVLSLGGLVVPILRELAEMTYQWDEDFVTDDRRFRERFGAAAQVTPLTDGAAATVAWARAKYAAG